MARSWRRWIAGMPRARRARNAATHSTSCDSMSDSGRARNAGPATTATSMPHGICWRKVFASWPVVTTGTCAWMREMHAQKKNFWCRCSQRKREAGGGIEPVWNRRSSASSAVKTVFPQCWSSCIGSFTEDCRLGGRLVSLHGVSLRDEPLRADGVGVRVLPDADDPRERADAPHVVEVLRDLSGLNGPRERELGH